LQPLAPYEFGDVAELYVTYVRGLAQLAQGAFTRAVAEFQRILDHPGVDPFATAWTLAHLQQARAAARAGDIDLARRRYEEFFTLWKDADGGLPAVVDARREYERIRPAPAPGGRLPPQR
jgi:hypothetical protein